VAVFAGVNKDFIRDFAILCTENIFEKEIIMAFRYGGDRFIPSRAGNRWQTKFGLMKVSVFTDRKTKFIWFTEY
jgi:hypothetical protein